MTGDELNELNEGLPWWVKKKIIDSRRQSHPPAPPPPPAPPRYPCSTSEPQSPRNVSKDFVGLLPPKVQPVGSWMKGNILFCQELVMWLNTWEEHPVPRFQFNCCSTLLWVEIHRMSWKSLESFPRFVRWVPQSDPREHALSLGWWTPKRGWGGLFPQLYRCRACREYRSEWHPPRIFLRSSEPGTRNGWQLDLGWLQLDILQKCEDGLHLWVSLGPFHGRAHWWGFVGRLGWCLQSIHKSNGLCARTDLSHRELARTRIQDVQHDLAWTSQRLSGVHWLHHRYVLRQLQMFSSRSDMALGSRVLHSVGAEHGPYVRRLVGVWPKHGGWCATRTISSSCCTLYLGHQRLVHCQLHLDMSGETVLVEVTPAGWMIVVWS